MGQKRNIKGKWLKPRLNQEIAIGALAADTLVSEGGGTAVDSSVLVTSIDVMIGIHNHTAGEGPLVIGVAHSDYSDAEIEAWLENLSSWSSEDKIAEEQARRLCRSLGMIGGAQVSERLWDGRQRKFKLNWRLGEGQALNFWCFNSDSNNLTTGTVVNIDGHANVKLHV